MHCKMSPLHWLHWTFSILASFKFSIFKRCTHRGQFWGELGRAQIPAHRDKACLSTSFSAPCWLSSKSLICFSRRLGKDCCPVTRKWDSSYARERKKQSHLRKSLVVCTNITLKYSVLAVCSVNQRKGTAGFYSDPRYTSLPPDLFL